MADDFHKRVARNEAAFRAVNEGIRAGRTDHGGRPQPFVCECAVLGCNQLIMLTADEYEAIRRSNRRFVVLPGHVIPDAEHPVGETGDGAVVVEKESDVVPLLHEFDRG